MSLGETIYRLRSERNLSQGDLADQLHVSRQSISKWETDGAVPELDKLIKLSQLFGVTLDELVLDQRPGPRGQEPASAAADPGPQQTGLAPRNIVGIILLCFAALIVLMITLLGSILAGLMLASPLLLCGIICFAVRRKPGLWCAWAVCMSVDLYLRYATGINWRLTAMTRYFTPELNYTRLVMGWVQLVCMALLPVITWLCFRKAKISLSSRDRTRLKAGWALLAAVLVGSRWWQRGKWIVAFIDWGGLLLFAVLIVITLGSWRSQKAEKAAG